jgi:hypothetical protein
VKYENLHFYVNLEYTGKFIYETFFFIQDVPYFYHDFNDIQQMPPPVLDAFGRVVSDSPPDDSPARCGIAMALEELSPFLPESEIQPIFDFYVEKGLGDRSEDVRKKMIIAAVAAINDHGKVGCDTCLNCQCMQMICVYFNFN